MKCIVCGDKAEQKIAKSHSINPKGGIKICNGEQYTFVHYNFKKIIPDDEFPSRA